MKAAPTLLAVLLLLVPSAALAQVESDTVGTGDDGRLAELAARYGRLAVSPHAHGTMVGVALRLPAGSARDPVGGEGTAHLLARVRERQAARVLDPARAVLSARVDRSSTVYTLLATPDAWAEELERADSLLFRSPVPPELVGAERSRILETLVFERGSPVQAFENEAASLLVDPEHPWASPVRGTPASLPTLDPEDLTAWQAAHMRPDEAALALAGPLTVGEVPPADSTSPSGSGTDSPPRSPWRVGDRVVLVQEVTSAWISVAYPVPDTLPRTTLELLAHLVDEELDPVPPDPDRYSVDIRLEDTPLGPVLLVQASVLPEAMARWEERILSTVAGLAETPMDEDFFRWRRRRFRTTRLLAEAAPEAEAARMTADLALLGAARTLDREVWRLDAAAVLTAARALGEPRVLLLGPDLTDDRLDGAGARDPAR